MKRIKQQLGFTLTELVVTTAIMGTLAAVAIPSYIETQAKAKSEKTMSNISEIGSKLGQLYQELSGEFGEMNLVGTLNTSISIDSTTAILQDAPSGANVSKIWGDIYADGIPTSPFGDLAYTYKISSVGDVVYTVDESGNVSVTVTKAQITFYDQEDPDGLWMKFAY